MTETRRKLALHKMRIGTKLLQNLVLDAVYATSENRFCILFIRNSSVPLFSGMNDPVIFHLFLLRLWNNEICYTSKRSY